MVATSIADVLHEAQRFHDDWSHRLVALGEASTADSLRALLAQMRANTFELNTLELTDFLTVKWRRLSLKLRGLPDADPEMKEFLQERKLFAKARMADGAAARRAPGSQSGQWPAWGPVGVVPQQPGWMPQFYPVPAVAHGQRGGARQRGAPSGSGGHRDGGNGKGRDHERGRDSDPRMKAFRDGLSAMYAGKPEARGRCFNCLYLAKTPVPGAEPHTTVHNCPHVAEGMRKMGV